MKKFFLLFLVFIGIALSSAALGAESSGDENSTGSFLDYIGMSSGGCGATAYDTPCNENSSTGLFASISCRVMKAFNAGVIPLYCKIVSNPVYLQAVDAAMMLYVVILGFSFIFGLVPMHAGTIVGKLLKVIIIYGLIINADLYFNLIYNTALSLPQDAVRIMLHTPAAQNPSGFGGVAGQSTGGGGSGACSSGVNDFFQYVDCGMREVFNSVTQAQGAQGNGQTYTKTNLKIFMLGLAIWQLGGDLIGGLFFAVIIGWIIAYFSIMIRYLLAMLSMMFLLMLGPIFIPTLLFERTREMGEEWMFMLISFIFQIVLVIAYVLMIQGFFIQFYDMVKIGLENPAVMQESRNKVAMQFSAENSGAYRMTDRSNSMGYTGEEAEKYYNKVYGDYKQKLPEMIFKLIEMMIIVTCSTMFLAVVPSLAALLTNRARYIRIFQGQSFGRADKLTQANLLGQNQDAPKFSLEKQLDEGRGGIR